ncbi:unnamed protein product [Sphagnum balticum]
MECHSSWAGRNGSHVAGRLLPGVAEQKVQIFCLPGFVEDLLLAGSLPRCFLNVRDPSMVSVGGSAVHGSRTASPSK